MRLAVELQGTIVGHLDGNSRTFDFEPTPQGLARFGVNSRALSVSIPLIPRQRRDRAGRRRNWFAELLPEGDQYEYLLLQGGIKRGDTLSFLARYGRDVAGALQIWDVDDPTEPLTPELRPVSRAEVRRLLEDPIGAPLANDSVGGKSSLGGVQPKVVLVNTGAGWAQALGGYPSTHILKPQLPGTRSSVIFDEEYGARIATRLGLAAFSTTIEVFDGLPALVMERFDRSDVGRVHQEDMSQALGARGNEKYQALGGVVSLQRIADLLERHGLYADTHVLARMVVLAVGIGNLDMHTKNLGLLHGRGGEVSLAPAYDVVPQAHHSNDGELALAVNKKYRHVDITAQDLVAEFDSWGMRDSERFVNAALGELREAVRAEEPHASAFPELRTQILGFVSNLRAGTSVGGV
ncbi:type II toxin-antitoxin system HipA family toxin [Leucobacter sp. NPDC015123]|uniref:type II toxin-antitoxin system HipA family toxin n=1 Tax=Leucobacter sp. NPDC015123 TaxID=3364129 RepID=UPI0036F48FBF